MNIDSLVRALRFDRPELPALRNLDLADREHVTLAFGLRHRDSLPAHLHAAAGARLAANAERFRRLRRAFEEAAGALQARSIDYAVLKGFSHCPLLSPEPSQRPQGDLDLLIEPGRQREACHALRSIGYEPLGGLDKLPLDHLPPLIRKTGWRWRGDYFDVDMPVSIELHFRLWDPATEKFPAPGVELFWDRRIRRELADFGFLALDPVDTAGYAGLHLLRHVLRGGFSLYHAYELAYLLETSAGDDAFWSRWRDLHGDELRGIEAIAFGFAAHWFGCRVPSAVQAEFENRPEPVACWFRRFSNSPLDAKSVPNKNEIWLHLGLIGSATDRRAVLRRRLLPRRGHRTFYDPHVPDSESSPRLRLAAAAYQARFSAARFVHHLRALLPTLTGGLLWWWDTLGIDPRFLRFLAAASLYNLGMTVFYLLFNLFLLERGFEEGFLGVVSSAMSIGSVAGSLPAAWLLSRWSLGRTLVAAFLGGAAMCALRTLLPVPAVLLPAALAGGVCFSLYAVSLAPTVARLTSERSRPFAFSLVFSTGIAIGALGGFGGGGLPGLFARALPVAISGTRIALLAGCAIAALGALSALKLRLPAPADSERRIYPRNPFIQRFLLVLFLWNLATGAFNPFFNAYFSRELRMGAAEIGGYYSASQLAQVIAVLAAPLVLRRLGPIGGVMAMQIATAASLAALASEPSGLLAGAVYAVYMAFQYMSEPGIYSLLMAGVEPNTRSGASALNFLVIFVAQALAAAVAGTAIRHFGYPAVLLAASLTAVVAGIALWALLGTRSQTVASIESTS